MASSHYELVVPYWTEGYPDRDAFLFALGYEYATVAHHVRFRRGRLDTVIHRENSSRVRMLCGMYGRRCEIDPIGPDLDPEQIRSSLVIAGRG